eukprot:353289-Chlamydomonas_euryale.AAC.6
MAALAVRSSMRRGGLRKSLSGRLPAAPSLARQRRGDPVGGRLSSHAAGTAANVRRGMVSGAKGAAAPAAYVAMMQHPSVFCVLRFRRRGGRGAGGLPS